MSCFTSKPLLPMPVSFIAGTIIGFLAVMPPGPLGIIILKNTLNHGKKSGLAISAGTTIIDFFYCLIFITATGSVFSRIGGVLERYSEALVLVQIASAATLIIYGAYSLRRRPAVLEIPAQAEPQKFAFAKRFAQQGPFFLGLALALTQFANPTFMTFMTYLSLMAHEHGFVRPEPLYYLVFSTGYALGIFLWLYLIVRLSLKYKTMISAEFIIKLNRFVGITLIGFGTYMGYRLGLIMKWIDMMRLVFTL